MCDYNPLKIPDTKTRTGPVRGVTEMPRKKKEQTQQEQK